MRWHNGKLSTNYDKRTMRTKGYMTLDCPSKNHEIAPGSAAGIFYIDAALTCEYTDLTVKVTTAKTNFLIPFGGDNSNFIGKISHQAGSTVVIAGHTNALGDPETVRADALAIDAADSVFAVKSGVTPNAARGIQVNKSGFKIRAGVISYNGGTEASSYSYDCSEYELPMTISGSYGFTKTGDGTVTLSGAYTATGAIVVSAGTLIIGGDAEFPDQQAITVKAGATLEVHQPLSNFAITVEEGANVVRSMDTISVPFDRETTNVTTVVKHRLSLEPGVKQPIALSSAYLVPCHDVLALEVLCIEPGSRDFTADDFEDDTEKTYGLPRTTFAVTKDADGMQHVIVMTRPVVATTSNMGNVGINGEASDWSNGAMPGPGADYLIRHQVGDVQNSVFRGDSLTLSPSAILRCRHSSSGDTHRLQVPSGEPVVVYPGVSTTQNYNGRDYPVVGDLYLVGEYGDSGAFNFDLIYGDARSDSYHGTTTLNANLTGAGTLHITGYKNGLSRSGLNGNNTNYFGRILMSSNGTTDANKGTQVRVSRPEAFGGRLDEFQANAVTMYEYAMVEATGNVALTNDMNRGFRIANAGFNCDAGKTFETSWPIVLNGTLYKHGAGTLVLAGAMTHDTSSTKKLIVRAGTVSALSDEAVAGLTLTATNDFTIAVSPRSSAVNGFGSVALTGDADPKINVAFDVASAERGANYRLPICTVESDSGLTADSFVVQKARGYVCTLVSETVDETKTRWSLDCTKTGLIMVVR